MEHYVRLYNTLYGNGEPLRDYVYVEDIARANVMALDKGSCATLNLGSGKGTSVRELFDIYAEHLGFTKDPILKPLRKGEVRDIFTTGDLAAEILGWSPLTSLSEGLRQTIDFIRNQQKSK